jgi:hypothetical protein
MRKTPLALLVLGIGLCAAAQDAPQSQPPQETAPAPAFGQDAPVLNPENPPVTGLDQPSLELPGVTRSFISPALQLSESGESNAANEVGGTGAESVTRVVGALDLQKFWSKSDFFGEYLGGGAFYGNPFVVKQLQAVGIEAVTRWRSGQVTLRDAFSYLPDGAFYFGTFGGSPGLGLAGLGLASGTMGVGMEGGALPGTIISPQLGSLENIPRLSNSVILDAVQAISPRSAITLAGGYSIAHFFDTANCAIPTDACLINSDEVTIEGGYSHLLSRRDQIGLVYGFQFFQFPQSTEGEIYNNLLNVRWSHTISGKMNLIAGVGPQYTELADGGTIGTISHWSISALVELHYKLGHGALIATYEKYTSSGSGFFAGAETQAARLGYRHPLGRTWEFFADLAYSHNSALQSPQNLGVPNLGVYASSYNSGTAGAILRKHMGRTYDFFAAYRFIELAFNVPITLGGSTGSMTQNSVGTIGLEWHPKPTRIE